MPSLINGGLDLLSWEKNKAVLYPAIKAASELFIGTESIGIADASMGEIFYEQNEKSKAMASLTKVLSAANLRGSIRVQYAVTGIMARIFISEKQLDIAIDTLENIRKKANEQCFSELLPNIDASLIQYALYINDADTYEKWLESKAISEHDEFYITSRYQLFIKAKVYTALGREMAALYIIGLLQEYVDLFDRTYFAIDLSILKAIILYRRGESWQETLMQAVEKGKKYGLVGIFADYYPNYLKSPRHLGALTDKELVVLKLMARGLNNNKLAEELQLNIGTVKFHVKNIMKKLDADNRTVAVKIAQEKNIL